MHFYLQLTSFVLIAGIILSSSNASAQPPLKDAEDASVELLTWGRDTIIARGRKNIYLSQYPPQHSVVVLIVNDVPWTHSDLRNMSGEFTVHAPQGQWIMAVVQVLYLRSDENGQCIDYLQLYDPGSAIGSSKICGKLNKDNKDFAADGVIGSRVFQSSSGMLQVHYMSDKGDPFPQNQNYYDLSFHMVEIVFTAYQDCAIMEEETVCGDKCISSRVTCDERINCGFEEDFGVDEIDCKEEQSASFLTKGNFLITLYTGAGLLSLILILVGAYHHHNAYRRIRNIPVV